MSGKGGRFWRRLLRRRRPGAAAAEPAGPDTLDPVYYTRRYPDLAVLTTTAEVIAHYHAHGRAEGRFASAAQEEEALYRQFLTPGAAFDLAAYRVLNPDLAEVLSGDRDYILHFIRHGRAEGRPAVFTGEAGAGPQPSWAPLLDVSQFTAWASGELSRQPVSRADAVRLFAEEGMARLAPLSFALAFDPAFYRAHYHPADARGDVDLYRLWLEGAITGSEAPNEARLLLPLLGDQPWPEDFAWQDHAREAGLPDGATRAAALLHLAEARSPPAEVLRFVPAENHALLSALARYRLHRGRYAEAEALLLALPEPAGWPWPSHLLHAEVLERLGRPAEARAATLRAIAAGADHFAPVHAVARLDLALGEWARALDWLERHHARWGDLAAFATIARTAIDRNYAHLVAQGHAALAGDAAPATPAAPTAPGEPAKAEPAGADAAGSAPPAAFTRLMEAGLARIEQAIARLESAPARLGPTPGGPVAVLANLANRQCTHYRVEQKAEQFAAIGQPMVLHGEDEAEAFIASLPGARAAIFYRLPANPGVIRAILAARGLGIPTYYEIDDLLFDGTTFPPPLATFADHISPADHAGLQFGVPLFRHALTMCDKAVASTPALLERMAPLTRSGTGLLVRNGLDSRNLLDLPPRRSAGDGASGPVRIFYGSNTLAHNADFAELAGPALLRLMDALPAVELVVVGHTALPDGFERHQRRIVRVPPIATIADYWALLAAMDLNLAVLHPDPTADCKSEIKWLEAAVFAIPSVVSGTRTYREVIAPGTDGLIAQTVEEWHAALHRLVTDPAERARMGAAARGQALARYGCATIARAWRDEFSDEGLPAPARRTRVLVCNVFYAPDSRGGATRVVEGNVARLAEAHPDIAPAVFTTDHLPGPAGRLRTSQVGGVPVFRVGLGDADKAEHCLFNPAIDEAFAQAVELVRPDVVHVHCVQRLGASLVEYLRARGIPYVITMHDGWWLSPDQFFLADGLLALPRADALAGLVAAPARAMAAAIRRNRLRPLLDGASRLLTVSESFARLCRDAGLARTEAIPNGIPRLPDPTPLPVPGPIPTPTGPLRLGHIGGRVAPKGADLIQAALLRGHYPRLHLTMIDGALPPGTTRETRWGATPVTLAAPTSPEAVAGLYESLDVLLAPSVWPESFGLVAREARHFGLWVIAGNRGAMAEDLHDGADGLVIDVGSRAGLDAALARLNSDPDRWRRGMAAAPAAPLRTAPFRTADHQADELATLYRSLAGAALHPAIGRSALPEGDALCQ